MNKNSIIILALVLILILLGAYYLLPRGKSNDSAAAPRGVNWSEIASREPSQLSGPVTTTVYDCAGGKSFLAKNEIKPMGGGHAEVFLADGTKLFLTQGISGSGVRYVNEGGSFEFWTKGDTAFINEDSVQTYADCKAVR